MKDEQNPQNQIHTESTSEKYPPELESFLWSLFKIEGSPLFKHDNQSIANIESFLKSQTVHDAGVKFIRTMVEEWKSQYPESEVLSFNRQPATDETKTQKLETLKKDQQVIASPESTPEFKTHVFPSLDTTPDLKRDGTEATNTSLPKVAPASTVKPGAIPSQKQPPKQVKPIQPQFRLPNGRVGVHYEGELECDLTTINVEKVELSQDTSLYFDPEKRCVVGIPSLAGEIPVTVFWRSINDVTPGSRTTTFKLILNPDPKSLWQVKEPDQNLPFQKPHLDSSLHKFGEHSLIAASRRGRSHEHAGSFRDDDFFLGYDEDTKWSILMVADGAGSAEFSREGSRIAVHTSADYLKNTLDDAFQQKLNLLIDRWTEEGVMSEIGTEFHYLYHGMATKAVQNIEAAAKENGTEPRQFSTTLLVTLLRPIGTDLFVASFWMGDGAIAAYGTEDTVKVLGSPDGGEYAGQTRFLDREAISDTNFGKRIRIGRLAGVEAVLLMTDGVSDPYFETDNGLVDPEKWNRLWKEIEPKLRAENPDVELLEWLHFFTKGHHDDRTIAIWF